MPPPLLILASASPRRRELLAESGYTFRVVEPSKDVECGLCSEEGPSGLVADLAYRKAQDVVRRIAALPGHDRVIVVAADTVVECDGQMLGKPREAQDARAMLRRLSGRSHRVLSGVCVWPVGIDIRARESGGDAPAYISDTRPQVRVAVTRLRMDRLSEQQIDQYVAGGQWQGKAGAFGYQDRLGWVHIDEGSQTNVVGLPMELLAEMLAEAQSGERGAGSVE